MQIPIRRRPDTGAGRSKTRQLSNKRGEGLVSQRAGGGGGERPFPSKFSLPTLTRRERKRTLGKSSLLSQWRRNKSPKRKFSDGLVVTPRLDQTRMDAGSGRRYAADYFMLNWCVL